MNFLSALRLITGVYSDFTNLTSKPDPVDILKEIKQKGSSSFRVPAVKSKRGFSKIIDQCKKEHANKVDVFMHHIKNNSSVLAKYREDMQSKAKPKKKRPNSSDMRKHKKGAMGKLLEQDSVINEISTPNGFFDTII